MHFFYVELVDFVTFLFHFLYFYLYIVFNILVCGCKKSFFFFWVVAFQYVPIEWHGFYVFNFQFPFGRGQKLFHF